MPNISLIPDVKYEPLQPYHWIYDNKPLDNINLKIELVNTAVDNNTAILTEAIGDAGTLGNRLNQALNANGSIKTAAIDAAMHNIANHYDGSISLSPSEITLIDPDSIYSLTSPVSFVRMLEVERAKLDLIADNATSLKLLATDFVLSTTYLFENETVEIVNSDTITWAINSNQLTASTAFPASAAHRHYYGIIPAPVNPIIPDYANYLTAAIPVPYVENSLRVYINGVRLVEGSNIYVPSYSAIPAYTTNTYTTDYVNGAFALGSPITISDIITIDFDINLI